MPAQPVAQGCDEDTDDDKVIFGEARNRAIVRSN